MVHLGRILALVVTVGLASPVLAQDKRGSAMRADPPVATVLAEDARISVIDLLWRPGALRAAAVHPAGAVYIVNGGALEHTFADGHSEVIRAKTGDVYLVSADEAPTFSTKNIGRSVVHEIGFYLKDRAQSPSAPPQASAAPPTPSGAGRPTAKELAQNNAMRVLDSFWRPGDASSMSKRTARAFYVVRGGVIERTYDDGSKEIVRYIAGEARAAGADDRAFSAKNVGKGVIHLVMFYPK